MRFALVAFFLLLARVAEGGKTAPRKAPIPAPLPDGISCTDRLSADLLPSASGAAAGAPPGSEYGANSLRRSGAPVNPRKTLVAERERI
jgi:hypothetical protein